jgi:hypothetical protein
VARNEILDSFALTSETRFVVSTIKTTVLDEDIAGEEPFFVELLTASNNKPKEGTAFYLECHCIGYPVPYVSFFHNNQRVQHNEKHKICECLVEVKPANYSTQ